MLWPVLFPFFLAFDFCRFCVVIRFFHPRHNGQWPPTSKDFYTRSYPLHYFLILILEKEPVFPFWMFSAKQGNYWYHFYNVFAMTRSLTGNWTWDLPHSRSQHSTTRLSRRRYKITVRTNRVNQLILCKIKLCIQLNKIKIFHNLRNLDLISWMCT